MSIKQTATIRRTDDVAYVMGVAKGRCAALERLLNVEPKSMWDTVETGFRMSNWKDADVIHWDRKDCKQV